MCQKAEQDCVEAFGRSQKPEDQAYWQGRTQSLRAVLARIKVLEEENRVDQVLQGFEREDKLQDAQEMQAEMRRSEK